MGVIIAIDGPAAAGKSTIARRLAERLGFTYIDTGAMYRAVALWALRQNIEITDIHRMEQLAAAAEIVLEPGSARVLLNSEDVTDAIRVPAVGEAASRVAAIPAVRRALVEKQRSIGAQANVVMEGRDIGTVVFPHANLKFFLDAHSDERVRRRVSQLQSRQPERIADEISDRDHRDRTRAESPLTQAPDAVYLDSTHLTAEEVEEAILKIVRARISNGKEYS